MPRTEPQPAAPGHPQILAARIAQRSRLRLLDAERRLCGAGAPVLGDRIAAALAGIDPAPEPESMPGPGTRFGRDLASQDDAAALEAFLRALACSLEGGAAPAAPSQPAAVLAFRPSDAARPPAASVVGPEVVNFPVRLEAADLPVQRAPAPVAAPEPVDGLARLSGAGPGLVRALRRAGVAGLDDLATRDPVRLAVLLGPAGRLVDLPAWIDAAARLAQAERERAGAVPAARTSASASAPGSTGLET